MKKYPNLSERLTRNVRECGAGFGMMSSEVGLMLLGAEVVAVENDRLRKALEDIANWDWHVASIRVYKDASGNDLEEKTMKPVVAVIKRARDGLIGSEGGVER